MPPEISNQESIQMMNRCKAEIVSLRSVISHLQPKAEAYDNLVTVLRLLPKPSIGMGEDLVWVLDNRIRELEPKPKAEKPE